MASLLCNVLFFGLFVNGSIQKRNHSADAAYTYQLFRGQLSRYRDFIEDASQETNYNSVMHSMVNANERLKQSISSLSEFKEAMSTKKLNINYLEDKLGYLDERTFAIVASYSLNTDEEIELKELVEYANNLLQTLPTQYTVENKNDFINKINLVTEQIE